MDHGILIERMEEHEFAKVWRPLYLSVFGNQPEFDVTLNMDEPAKAKVRQLRELRQHLIKIFLVAREGDQLAGWSWGFQSMDEEFYMCNSAVLPNYQRKGIYTSLLQRMMQEAREHGFQVVTSRHHMGNNAIIIPKLKFGFQITGTELDTRFGLFVKLAYHMNPDAKKVYEYRTGSVGPGDDIARLIK